MKEIPIFPGYKIIKALPQGGWADVYLAEFKGEKVAIKKLKEQFYNDQQKIKDFFFEAETLSKFDSPNLAKVIEVGPKNSVPYYFSMAYYSEGNLNNYIKTQKILTTKEIKIIGNEICKALNIIHKEGLLHLDLKPSNILFGKNNQIVLSDFGISRNLNGNSDSSLIYGTPQYMSPEHFGGEVNFTSDLYSLGIILYYAASGTLPFESSDFVQMGLMHKNVNPFPIRQYNPAIDKRIEKIILKLLEKKPTDRIQTAKEIIIELEKVNIPFSNDQYYLKILQFNDENNITKTRIFKKCPVTISKYKDSKSNFCLLDPFASKEHATITNPEPGKYLLLDHSKNGTRIRDKVLVDESIYLDNDDEDCIVGNTRLRISSVQLKRFSLSKILPLSAIIFILFAVVYLFLTSNGKGDLPSIKLVIPDSVYAEDVFKFDFYPSSKTLNDKELIIAPYGKDSIKINLPVNERQYKYLIDDLHGNGRKKFTFAVNIKNKDGSTGDWLEKDILLVKKKSMLYIRDIVFKNELTINVPLEIEIQIEGDRLTGDNEIYMTDGFKDIKAPLNKLPKYWSFSKIGKTEFKAQIITNNNIDSKIFQKKLNIKAGSIPKIYFTSYPQIIKNNLIFSFEYSDDKFKEVNDFAIKLIWSDATNQIIDAQNKTCSLQIDKSPGNYSVWLQIKNKDGNQGISERYNVKVE